ncbi:hypothetical protein JCM16814_34570 [Desulfobaculum senezii]
MLHEGLPCPMCSAGTLERVVSEESITYKGRTKSVPGYISYACPNCHEELTNPKENHAIEQELLAFRREVDGLLSPKEIFNLRDSLGLTQRAFAEKLGIGEKSFARYETGTVTQSKAMDNLLRVIKEYPQAMDTITPSSRECVEGNAKIVKFVQTSKAKPSEFRFRGLLKSSTTCGPANNLCCANGF